MFWHKHKWKVTGAQHLERGTYMGPATMGRCPITEVLMVCDCGKVQTITLDGHWTLEQLQPAHCKLEADKEFFRNLGVKL